MGFEHLTLVPFDRDLINIELIKGFGGQQITIIPDKNIVCVIQAKATASGKIYDDLLPFIME